MPQYIGVERVELSLLPYQSSGLTVNLYARNKKSPLRKEGIENPCPSTKHNVNVHEFHSINTISKNYNCQSFLVNMGTSRKVRFFLDLLRATYLQFFSWANSSSVFPNLLNNSSLMIYTLSDSSPLAL